MDRGQELKQRSQRETTAKAHTLMTCFVLLAYLLKTDTSNSGLGAPPSISNNNNNKNAHSHVYRPM